MARRTAAAPRVRSTSRTKSQVREWIEAIGMALLLTLVIRTFVIQAFRIPSGSMLDTLQVGDFLFVDKMVYGARVPFTDTDRIPGFRKPRTGDIVVFKFPLDTKVDYIKRVIATEGQTVRVVDKAVYVDGKKLVEPYTKHTDPRIIKGVRDNFPQDDRPFVVPHGRIFCMGDNRDNSWDSRFWGPVPFENVKGRAFLLYWSWDAERRLPRFNRMFHIVH